METNKIEIKTLIISIATIILIEAAMKVTVSKNFCNHLIILGMARLLEIILIMLIALKWGKGLSSLGMARSKMAAGLKNGLLWSAGFGIIVSIAFVLLYLAGVNPLDRIPVHLPTKPDEKILFFLVGGLLGPIAEEVFFRGMLYGFFRRWGILVAIFLSTLIFVLIHPINNVFPVTQAVGGILFAIAYEFGGSLLAPITIHALGNMAIFTLSFIF